MRMRRGCARRRVAGKEGCEIRSWPFGVFRGSHRRAKDPWRELVFAIAPRFALRLLTGRSFKDQVEDASANFLYRFLAIDNGAAIEVHVLLLVRIQSTVGRELQRWRRFAAVCRTSAGSE